MNKRKIGSIFEERACEFLKEQNFISAVVYVRNSEETIAEFLKTINDYLKEKFLSYEIICVNDASADNSIQKIKSFSAENGLKNLSLINMSYFQGTEKSMLAGIDLSIGDFVFEFDITDITFTQEILDEVYYTCLKNFDIVSACPSGQNDGSCLTYSLYNKLLNCKYKIQKEAFRIISRRAINRIQTMTVSIPFRKIACAKCGLKTTCVEYSPVKKFPQMTKEEKKMIFIFLMARAKKNSGLRPQNNITLSL